ncbi:MAG: segregation and condensation protein A [Clostridia bacterium]
MQNILTLETNKYAIKIENFEGPIDLLLHLIDKNKMNICDVKLSEITDQYIEYIKKMEEMNLEITSEFLVMASTLIYIKSKSILPKNVEEGEEISAEELLHRIIEYKKYKEITKKLRQMYEESGVRYYKAPENIKLPKQELKENQYNEENIVSVYKQLLERNTQKINENAKNIEKIAITDTYTVASKVKEMLKELIKKPKFVFNALFSLNKCEKEEVITAFSGLLELSRRNKVVTSQDEIFGDISVQKHNKVQ